jgi:aquaporin TIP
MSPEMSGQPDLARRCTAELLGTFLFVFVGAGSAVAAQYLFTLNTTTGFSNDPRAGLLVAALANGIGLAVAISATMAVSGGSLNPAVTLSLFVGKKLPARDVIPYVVAELVGAIFAGLLLITVLPSSPGKAVDWGAPSISVISVSQATVLELVMTFFLVLAVYGTAVDKRAPKIAGFGIGLVVLVDVLVGGPFTGAAMNPARAMGPMIASWTFPGYWYIYWIGPLIGGALAGLIYNHVLEDKATS